MKSLRSGVGASDRFEQLSSHFSKVDPRSLAAFLDQFGLMLQCGLTPGTALDALGENQSSKKLEGVIEDMNQLIHQGHTVTNAMSRHPDVFPSTVIMLVRVGEQGGDLARQFRRASEMLQRSNSFIAKIKGAIASPLVTAMFCSVILFAIVKLVFPRFLSMYESMDIEFPAISRLVILVVNFINHPVTLICIVGLVVFSVFAREQLTEKIFNFLLIFPPTKLVVGKILCATTCETLATLHKDGVPLHRILGLLADSQQYSVHRTRLEDCKKVLVSTGSLHESLGTIDYFPNFFHAMVAIGEETGALDELLHSCQSLLEQEIEVLVEQISNALEPAVTCLMGISMAILFIGMFLPIYGILNKLGGL
jgi:type IV pilus assembly protein PilC